MWRLSLNGANLDYIIKAYSVNQSINYELDFIVII